MDWILEQPQEKNYYLNIREFASGSFEATMNLVKPMRAEYTEAIVDGLPVVPPCDKPIGFTKPMTEEEEAAKAQANHKRAVRRASQNIRWLCKAMEVDRLLTLTYRENLEDRDQVRRDFQEFLRLVRKQEPEWKYVAVLEKQDRGAFHIHCAVKGFQRIKFIRKCWYQALGGFGDEQGAVTPGQVDITSPKKRWGSGVKEWATEKLAGYITKYLAKTFDETAAEKRRYWAAKGVSAPPVRRLWVGGANMFEAIQSCLATLELDCGLRGVDFDWWLSSNLDCLWISGKAEK